MPGFGYGPFGYGPFGSYDWAKQVLFRDLPALDRETDAKEGGGRLERFVDSVKPSFDELLRFTRNFGDLRDADRVRTQFQGRLGIKLLQATASANGRVISVRVENADPSDPFATLGSASVGWILKDDNGREFTVNSVHKLHDRDGDPLLELAGSSEVPVTALELADLLTGLVAFVANSGTVIGSGTLFLSEVAPGDYVAPTPGGVLAKVQSVTSNTVLVLTMPYAGQSVAVSQAVVTQASRGEAVMRPPALIRELGEDFGLEVDTHEPEAFQRSSVRDVVQWLSVKGAQRSYDIRGKIAGYRVTAFGLWRIDPVPDAFPPSEVFELPAGSGKFYTANAPIRPFFDEFPADTIPLDYFCYETVNWTTDGIVPPSPSLQDGTPIGEAIGYGSGTTALPVMSATDLNGGRWKIRVGPGADLAPILGLGSWYARFGAFPGEELYLETLPVEEAPGEWTFEIMAGLTPAFDPLVDLFYDCRKASNCGFCRASAIRIEVVPVEVLSDPDALLDGVLARLVAKLQQVIPIHVRFSNIAHVIGPIQVPLNITVQGAVGQTVTAPAMVGYYYDILPADELPVDQDHVIVNGSVSTTP